MKVTVSINVQADELSVIAEEAMRELGALHPGADWSIEEVNIWGRQDAASRDDGLVTIWNAEVKATATVDLSV